MTSRNSQHFETLAIHTGQKPDPSTGAIMTPVYLSSTFVQESPGVHKGFDYSRADNPTRTALEANLASLEKAEYGTTFASGCAAMASVILGLEKGAHVICCDDVYGGTHRLFTQVLGRSGYEFDFIDLTKTENLEKAMKPNTKLVWVETPTNPLLKIFDIQKLSEVAQAKGVDVLVDNTFMSPYFQSPLALGAQLVMHSTTKYIGGHSDLIGGFVATNDEKWEKTLKFNQKSIGAVPSPFDCFLMLRSTKTLALRMQRHEQNAMKIAQWLESHSAIEKVSYPGLKSHPQHDLAKKQMQGFGGMISFVIRGGLAKAKSFLENVRVFSLAESLGGVESLIEHPAIMTHASLPAENRKALGIDDGLIRISVGIENDEDLLADLDQALKA